MEAATLQKKKHTLSKGKLKKTIKNIICRPDPVLWPVLQQEQEESLSITITKLKVLIPEFIKLPWSELKNISKESRPKPPPLPKVQGLIFGISQCSLAISRSECKAVILEASINPRALVHSVIEECLKNDIPVVCLHDLRKISSDNFGIITSCLGVENNCVELKKKIKQLAQTTVPKTSKTEETIDLKMDVDMSSKEDAQKENNKIEFKYLYRTNKKIRMFVPPTDGKITNVAQNFSGQDFIEFTDKSVKQEKRKDYMNMILKRISNNPNRKPKKTKTEHES